MEGLGIDIKLLVAQLINFGLLVFLLNKFLYKPLIKLLDDRKQKIEEAEENNKKIELRLTEIESREAKIIKTAKDKMAEERKMIMSSVETERQKILIEAKMASQREVAKATETIHGLESEALNKVNDKIVNDLVEKVTQKITSDKAKGGSLLKDLLKNA